MPALPGAAFAVPPYNLTPVANPYGCTGSKAEAVFEWAGRNGRACLLLDYSGCGQSEGDFAEGTLSAWRDEVLELIEAHCSDTPVLLIGSSMGGWLMLLVALALPPEAQKYLAWNPLAHGMELIRLHLLDIPPFPQASIEYLAGFAIVSLFLGFIGYYVNRHKVLER